MHRLRLLGERAWGTLLGADPGLVRLRSAGRTTLALAVVLAVLALLAGVTGQPTSGVLVGALVAMAPAMTPPDPDPHHRRTTTAALVVLAAAVALAAGVLLAPHRLAADLGLVLVTAATFYAGRFGPRGTTIGTAGLLAYAATLIAGGTPDQLPWLVTAVTAGTVTGQLVLRTVLPDRPERTLVRMLAAFQVRLGAVVEAVDAVVQAGRPDEHRLSRVRARTARLVETAVTVHGQLGQRRGAADRQLAVDEDDLLGAVFDATLVAERLGAAAEQAAATAAAVPLAIRARLHTALDALTTELRTETSAADLEAAGRRAAALADTATTGPTGDAPDPTGDVRRLGLALQETADTMARLHTLVATPADRRDAGAGISDLGGAGTVHSGGSDDGEVAFDAAPDAEPDRLRPHTRQAIQVAVATALAILAGNLLSETRWYWAYITALVVFLGTESSGQILTRGWQRLLGTGLGVIGGVLLATVLRGEVGWSIVLAVACFSLSLYFAQAGYAVSVFFTTVVLALIFGLLGEFSLDVLLVRVEETAAGAAIGVLVALVVLPAHTGAVARDAARDLLTTLADLVEATTGSLLGEEPTAPLPSQAAELSRRLQRLRTVAEPLTSRSGGQSGRHSARHGLEVLSACSHYGLTLARTTARPDPAVAEPALQAILRSAARRAGDDIDALAKVLSRRRTTVYVYPADDLLDAAEEALLSRRPDDRRNRTPFGPDADGGDADRALAAVRTLRRLDSAVVGLARDLGAAVGSTGSRSSIPGASSVRGTADGQHAHPADGPAAKSRLGRPSA